MSGFETLNKLAKWRNVFAGRVDRLLNAMTELASRPQVIPSQESGRLMSNLEEHARRELQLCGQYAEDPEYSESIIRAVGEFASYGHSGGSAMVAREQLHALLGWKALSPLTDDPHEWIDRSDASGVPMWQNKREPSVFSTDGGKTHYSIGPDGDPGDAGDSDTASVPAGELVAFGLLMDRARELVTSAIQRAQSAEAELADLGDRISTVIAEAVAGERERILARAGALKITLARPGNGPAHWEESDVVPFTALRDLITGDGDG